LNMSKSELDFFLYLDRLR